MVKWNNSIVPILVGYNMRVFHLSAVLSNLGEHKDIYSLTVFKQFLGFIPDEVLFMNYANPSRINSTGCSLMKKEEAREIEKNIIKIMPVDLTIVLI